MSPNRSQSLGQSCFRIRSKTKAAETQKSWSNASMEMKVPITRKFGATSAASAAKLSEASSAKLPGHQTREDHDQRASHGREET